MGSNVEPLTWGSHLLPGRTSEGSVIICISIIMISISSTLLILLIILSLLLLLPLLFGGPRWARIFTLLWFSCCSSCVWFMCYVLMWFMLAMR